MDTKEITIQEEQVQLFLKDYYKSEVKILEYERLGTGWVAVGYKVKFEIDGAIKQIALRTLKPIDFSHDYPADRAGYFLLQHDSSKIIPDHIESYGVVGVSSKDNSVIDLTKSEEFFQIVEWAQGQEYIVDLERIFNEGKLNEEDLGKASRLGEYLANLHNIKPDLDDEVKKSLYKRHTRDMVGSVFLMDVLDTYPKSTNFVTKEEIADFVKVIYEKREELKFDFTRLTKIHGDFHPGNIRFDESNKIYILDASRAIWGEPADDLACLMINYIWYSMRKFGNISGIYIELLNSFWNSYVRSLDDKGVLKQLPLFFAIRSFVLNHPIFFDVPDNFRRTFYLFNLNLLKSGEFDINNLNKFFE